MSFLCITWLSEALHSLHVLLLSAYIALPRYEGYLRSFAHDYLGVWPSSLGFSNVHSSPR